MFMLLPVTPLPIETIVSHHVQMLKLMGLLISVRGGVPTEYVGRVVNFVEVLVDLELPVLQAPKGTIPIYNHNVVYRVVQPAMIQSQDNHIKEHIGLHVHQAIHAIKVMVVLLILQHHLRHHQQGLVSRYITATLPLMNAKLHQTHMTQAAKFNAMELELIPVHKIYRYI
jgi:hypothetical protein